MKFEELERLIEKEHNEIEKLKIKQFLIDKKIDKHIARIDRFRLKQRLCIH